MVVATWTRCAVRSRRRGLPVGVIRIGTHGGRVAYVDFPTATTRAWTLGGTQSVRCYQRGTLLAWQFAKDPPPADAPSGVARVRRHDKREDSGIRVYCAGALKQLQAAPGYYLAHREGPWFVVADLTRPLPDEAIQPTGG